MCKDNTIYMQKTIEARAYFWYVKGRQMRKTLALRHRTNEKGAWNFCLCSTNEREAFISSVDRTNATEGHTSCLPSASPCMWKADRRDSSWHLGTGQMRKGQLVLYAQDHWEKLTFLVSTGSIRKKLTVLVCTLPFLVCTAPAEGA
jgi:hypothetical protein